MKMGVEGKDEVKYFSASLGIFFEAYPHENQLISSHVWNQAYRKSYHRGYKTKKVSIKNEAGFEDVVVLQKKDVRVVKRIFHMTKGEKILGIDFVITKYRRRQLFMIGVQVKRNRNKSYYEFGQRERQQFENFTKYFPNGYYLFVDETGKKPRECFVRISEVRKILEDSQYNSRITNEEVAKYCRGPNPFYDAFYKCRRGSKMTLDNFVKNVSTYAKITHRVVVELLVGKEIPDFDANVSIPDITMEDMLNFKRELDEFSKRKSSTRTRNKDVKI